MLTHFHKDTNFSFHLSQIPISPHPPSFCLSPSLSNQQSSLKLPPRTPSRKRIRAPCWSSRHRIRAARPPAGTGDAGYIILISHSMLHSRRSHPCAHRVILDDSRRVLERTSRRRILPREQVHVAQARSRRGQRSATEGLPGASGRACGHIQ